jgi:predicted nucleic acid-binding protein
MSLSDMSAGGPARPVLDRPDPRPCDLVLAARRVHNERPYSFVDATSFALMRRKRVPEALAFDGDFAAAGFNELRA